MPFWAVYLPVYSFWHFDDFSWGNTRVVLGDQGKKIYAVDVEEVRGEQGRDWEGKKDSNHDFTFNL